MAAIVRASEELRIVDHDVLVPVETDTICRLLVAAGDAANANAAGDHVASSRAPNQKLVLFSDGWLDLISQGSIGKVVNRFKDGIKPLEAEKRPTQRHWPDPGRLRAGAAQGGAAGRRRSRGRKGKVVNSD